MGRLVKPFFLWLSDTRLWRRPPCRQPGAILTAGRRRYPLSSEVTRPYAERMNCAPAQTREFRFETSAFDGAARAGVLHTAHGPLETPAFMAVGTAGTVKAMPADAVRATGTQCVLGNTYHLMLRPGADRIAVLGGLHRFMDWPGPILTDSGG